MPRRPYGRRNFPILPLLLLIGGLFWIIGIGGCGVMPRLTDPKTPELRDRAALERIAYAVEALRVGNSAGADRAIEDALRLQGDSDGQGTSGAFAAVARELNRSGRPAAASRLLTTALKNEEIAKNPMVWSELATAHAKSGDETQATIAEKEAQTRAETVLKRIGQLTPAEPVSDSTASAIELFRQTGLYYSDVEKDSGKAFMALREALRLKPNDPSLMNDLGYTLADLGTTTEEINEAVRLTRAAAEAQPDEANSLDSYGWALFKKGDLAGARRVLREAAESDMDVPEIHYHFGVILGEMGQTRQAALEMDRALRLRPDYKEAKQGKEKLRQPPGQGPQDGV